MALTATVGREAELDSIQAFIDAVPRGPSALSISGPAGIGKTTIWEVGVDTARNQFDHVLVCRGIEAEASLSFAALSELITPVFDQVAPELTAPRRRALEVALLLVEPEGATPDRLAIGLAVLDALRALAADGPCLIAIDDAQWLDSSSAMVLQIALKRLDGQPIGVLVTARESPGVSLPIELDRCFGERHLIPVPVGPITLTALHHLLRDRLSIDIRGSELDHLHAMTGGNPFFALEVGREMVRTNARSTGLDPLRVPDSLRELVGGRLARLPSDTADVLLAVAALARPTIDVLTTAHGDRKAVVRALDIAAREGVVRLDDSRIRFSHPLHASICYQEAPVWKRQAVHRALAAAVTDIEERALHLARGSDSPDAAIAAELDQAAESAAARGAPAVGAELCRLAATLTPSTDAAQSRRRRSRAARFDRLAGNITRALMTLGELRGECPPGVERADVLCELSMTRQFDIATWCSLCDEALEDAAGDDVRSARVLLSRTQAHMLRGDVEATLADASTALALAERAGARELQAEAIARITHAETYGGRITPGLVERGIEIEQSLDTGLEYLNSPRAAHARRVMKMGDVEVATALLDELAGEARARGDERTHAQLLWALALAEWHAGRWDDALAHTKSAVEESEQRGEGHMGVIAGRTRGLIEADLGLTDLARETSGRGAAAARAMSDDIAEIASLGVLGRIELMLDNPEAAAGLLRELPGRMAALGVNDPTMPLWADAIETFVTVRDAEAARRWFDHWDSHARQLASPLALATTARCRALILAAEGDLPSATVSFEQSLRALGGVTYPLECGRTLLCMGSVLRQAQQRGAARDALEQALAVFEGLGGRLWAEKARAELARISGRRPPSEVLTETELQVATLAGQGRSNKEIAASLHLGVSTVEAHLSSVYRKLNVKRAELASALAELST